MSRYIIEVDNEQECYKILDTESKIGEGDEEDIEWVASAYDIDYANSICHMLNVFNNAAIIT